MGWGVHRLVNGAGEQVLVAFGQAEPRNTSPDRARRAEETALEIAVLRAEAALGTFVGETVESEQTEDTKAFAERVRARFDPGELEGVRSVGRWIEARPANGQRLGGGGHRVDAIGRGGHPARSRHHAGCGAIGGRPAAAGAGRREGDGEILEGVNVDPDDL